MKMTIKEITGIAAEVSTAEEMLEEEKRHKMVDKIEKKLSREEALQNGGI